MSAYDMVRVFVDKMLSMRPEDAAVLIYDWGKVDPELANWAGRWIGWIDEEFQAKVYAEILHLDGVA